MCEALDNRLITGIINPPKRNQLSFHNLLPKTKIFGTNYFSIIPRHGAELCRILDMDKPHKIFERVFVSASDCGDGIKRDVQRTFPSYLFQIHHCRNIFLRWEYAALPASHLENAINLL